MRRTPATARPGGRTPRPRRRWRRRRRAGRAPRPPPGRRGGGAASTLGGVDDVDARLERAIGALLDDRRAGATICPSEAARAVDPQGWRELMPAAPAAAGRLGAGREGGGTPRGAG